MAEFVTPSALEADMPFTFAATGTVEGAVVQVHSVLAASPNEVILEAPAEAGLQGGPMQLLVQDMETGETAATNPFVGYTASARRLPQGGRSLQGNGLRASRQGRP